jgi:hypothetical protein
VADKKGFVKHGAHSWVLPADLPVQQDASHAAGSVCFGPVRAGSALPSSIGCSTSRRRGQSIPHGASRRVRFAKKPEIARDLAATIPDPRVSRAALPGCDPGGPRPGDRLLVRRKASGISSGEIVAARFIDRFRGSGCLSAFAAQKDRNAKITILERTRWPSTAFVLGG